MSTLHVFQSEQKLPVSLEEAWKFFSDPNNLKVITPPSLNLVVTNEILGNKAYAGQIITYTVKPLLGIAMNWMTEITHVEEGKYFIDEQRKGPYKLWHHQHHFSPIEGGVLMKDIVHYRLPMGFLGDLLVHKPIVFPKLKEIFDFRTKKVEEIFGKYN